MSEHLVYRFSLQDQSRKTWREQLMLAAPGETSHSPQGRLVQLLHQAAAWQVSNTRHKGKQPWTIKS